MATRHVKIAIRRRAPLLILGIIHWILIVPHHRRREYLTPPKPRHSDSVFLIKRHWLAASRKYLQHETFRTPRSWKLPSLGQPCRQQPSARRRPRQTSPRSPNMKPRRPTPSLAGSPSSTLTSPAPSAGYQRPSAAAYPSSRLIVPPRPLGPRAQSRVAPRTSWSRS